MMRSAIGICLQLLILLTFLVQLLAGSSYGSCQIWKSIRVNQKAVESNHGLSRMDRLVETFGTRSPVIGMIHLSGYGENRINRAIREIRILEENGADAALVENYHGNTRDVIEVFERVSRMRKKPKIVLGVNILPNEFEAFEIASRFGATFIQLDFVSGQYNKPVGTLSLDIEKYQQFREKYPDVFVLGGVHPKYYTPVEGSDLRADIYDALQRADAVVVTGAGTGKSTPLAKIREFREILGPNEPLIIGAGVNGHNVRTQFPIGNGIIIGSHFKPDGDTTRIIDSSRVSRFMEQVGRIRNQNPELR